MDESKNSSTNPVQKSSPIKPSNIIFKLSFCWFTPPFVKGLKRQLNEDQIHETYQSHKSSSLGDKLEAAWTNELVKNKNPSLTKALLSVFKWELGCYGIFSLFFELLRISQPYLISKLLSYYDHNATNKNKNGAYVYAGLIILTGFVGVLIIHNYQFKMMTLGMQMRVAVSSLIYRKALKLSKSALADTTVGRMVNILTNDVGRFDVVTQLIHSLWISPLELCLAGWLLYSSVGTTGLAGIILLTCFLPLQVLMGRLSSKFRFRTAIRTDERVRLMNEIVSGIQVIKMYTWEKPFAKLVEHSRKKEIQEIKGTLTVRAMVVSFYLILNTIAVFLCVLTYSLTGKIISAAYVYTVTSYYGALNIGVTMSFPSAVTKLAETRVSVSRIQKYLLYEEVPSDRHTSVKGNINSKNGSNRIEIKPPKNNEVGIHLLNTSTKWLHSSPEYNIENITFDVNSSQLIAVVGPVGGGKTTLLHTMLKELPPQKGTVDVRGTISYSSQEPWVFGSSIKQNILFGQEYDAKKYEDVVRVCALERDFQLFPYGDRTLVGERGITLSGGQRARVNLARAVYKDADIYLLDDPLSAVDTQVGKQIFDDCICGYLKDKCVVLVTHQLQYLRNVHLIYLLQGGQVSASGNYQQMKSSNIQFCMLLAECDAGKKTEEATRKKLGMKVKESNDDNSRIPVQEIEHQVSGIVSWHVYKSYLKAGGNWCKNSIVLGAFILCQIFCSCTDYFLKIWVNVNQKMQQNSTEFMTKISNNDSIHITDESSGKLEQFWMKIVLHENRALLIYTCLVVLTVVITLSRSVAFFRYCMAASGNLHKTMFNKIVFSTMRFFNTNPTGRILNRFSKDIGGVDEILPVTMVESIQIGLTVAAILLVVGILNPWILIPTFVIIAIFHFLRKMFLATSRNIKRVEAATRSPIYTHLSASLQGLTTVRAFGAQALLTKEFDHFQDANSAAHFLFLNATRTFGFWLDLNCVIYIGLITISILFIENEVFGGNVGLALSQSISLTGTFQWGMKQWSELENHMTSVERIKEYADIEPELDSHTEKPPKDWPDKGCIVFRDTSLRYSLDEPYVLKNIFLEIKSKEKVGIVGRTGAGKSSLIQALFRLTNIEGQILIDNVDSQRMSLKDLRSNISIIPQEPVLFSGTLRKNLDPFDEHDDIVLWKALEDVELNKVTIDLPKGLDTKIAESGANFSVGQRQLVCLARAIIRKNNILVLDEATSNVDPQTDALIQNTIRQKFGNCTVLTIAHRLHTIMDSDKVLVMDTGRAVEFDHPYMLLQNENSLFSRLVLETGAAMAENLRTITAENFKNSYLNHQH